MSLQRYLAESDPKVNQFLAVVSWCWCHPTGAGLERNLLIPQPSYGDEAQNQHRSLKQSLPMCRGGSQAPCQQWSLKKLPEAFCQLEADAKCDFLILGQGRVPRLTKPLCYLFSGPLEAALVPRGLCLVSLESLSALLVR